jgi:putative FmdB family regulatory protein
MPMYDYQCGTCDTTFEAFVSVSRFKRSRRCPACAGRAQRIILTAPSLGLGLASRDRLEYAQHNVTYTGESRDGDQVIGFSPNSHEDQCHCEGCNRHRRRASVTETADKGKDVAIWR